MESQESYTHESMLCFLSLGVRGATTQQSPFSHGTELVALFLEGFGSRYKTEQTRLCSDLPSHTNAASPASNDLTDSHPKLSA
jgi:hypothetical protein